MTNTIEMKMNEIKDLTAEIKILKDAYDAAIELGHHTDVTVDMIVEKRLELQHLMDTFNNTL